MLEEEAQTHGDLTPPPPPSAPNPREIAGIAGNRFARVHIITIGLVDVLDRRLAVMFWSVRDMRMRWSCLVQERGW